jgi:hypothetical protein
MDDTIKQIETLIAANRADKNRTPFLDMALGGLQTARNNTQWHLDALAKKAAAKAAPAAASAPTAK